MSEHLRRREYLRQLDDGRTARVCREYTDVNGVRRRAVYDTGGRWIMEDGSIVLVGLTIRKFDGENRLWNPWEAARDVVDTWVVEEE